MLSSNELCALLRRITDRLQVASKRWGAHKHIILNDVREFNSQYPSILDSDSCATDKQCFRALHRLDWFVANLKLRENALRRHGFAIGEDIRLESLLLRRLGSSVGNETSAWRATCALLSAEEEIAQIFRLVDQYEGDVTARLKGLVEAAICYATVAKSFDYAVYAMGSTQYQKTLASMDESLGAGELTEDVYQKMWLELQAVDATLRKMEGYVVCRDLEMHLLTLLSCMAAVGLAMPRQTVITEYYSTVEGTS